MSVVDSAAGAVKAPIGWAKAKPAVFIIFLLLVVILVIRFRNAIQSWFAKVAKWPVVGRPIAFLTGVNAGQDAPPAAVG